MQEQPTQTSYTVSDFVEWDFTKQLELTPKFQRRDVWSPKAKSYLIDTIIRRMPIPPLYIRTKIDPLKHRSLREVVDGQQRLRAVLGYLKNEFQLLKAHNTELGGSYYSNLPESTQKDVLKYAFAVYILPDMPDPEVLELFARFNTYTVKLNAQELRNATYFGPFKSTVYRIALHHYNFWLNNNIFSHGQITRMAEAEFVSEILVTLLDGIRQTKTKDLRRFYDKYDEEFPESLTLEKRFDDIIDIIGNTFGDKLKSNPFRRKPLFFSLFIVLYDAKYGIPNSSYERFPITLEIVKRFVDRLKVLEDAVRAKEPPEQFVSFVDAQRRATADPGRRKIRHDVVWQCLLQTKNDTAKSS